MTRVGLVACSAKKLTVPAPARELYRSPLFRKSRAWVEANCDCWYILSAKHGLLNPDKWIEPYDLRLGSVGGPDVDEWAAGVGKQLAIESLFTWAPQPIGLDVLGGRLYQRVLDHVPFVCWWNVPMEGMGIGQQLQWLTRQVAA